MDIERIGVDSIRVPEGRRPVDESRVKALAESIEKIGLQTPITVWIEHDGEDDIPHLVAGAHRLAACKLLGIDVDAFVTTADDIDRDLWEIDENLCRSELSKVEEGEHLARRQELWKARENRVAQVEPPEIGYKKPPPAEKGFAADTSKSTGKSKASINRAIKRTHEITSEARDLIRNTKLDAGVYLDKLMKMPEDEQVDRVQRDLAALADKDRREALKREAAEREREAKEARKHAKNAVCNFLLDALSNRQWDQLIGLIEDAGGTLRASDLRDWQAPMKSGEAA